MSSERVIKAATGMAKSEVAVVIPTKNEEGTIAQIVHRIRQAAPDYSIVVVDGHSTDRTPDIVRSLGVPLLHDSGRGKGDGIRTAVENVDADGLVFIDADGSHDPADIPRLVAPILEGRAEHVSTSRMRGGSDELHGDFEKFLKIVGSAIITMGINYRFGVRLTDSQNGFRAIRRNVALKLGLKENITTIEQEMIIKTLKHGYRMVEIPAHEYERQSGESKIVLRKVWLRYVVSWLKNLLW